MNIGTSGHVDHGKCARFSEYVLLNGQPMTGYEIEQLVTKTGKLVASVDGGQFYTFDDNNVVAIDETFNPVNTKAVFYKERYIGPLVNIKTRTGRTLSVTPSHPLLINRKGLLLWMPAGKLEEGDHIAILSFVPLPEDASFQEPIDAMREKYTVVTWNDYQQLRLATSDFDSFETIDAKQIDQLRILAGLSLTEFCKEAKMDPSTYHRLVRGERPLDRWRQRIITTLASKKMFHPSPDQFLIYQDRGHGYPIRTLKQLDMDEDLVKWLAFVWSEGSSGPDFIAVTQTVQRDMLEEWCSITRHKMGAEHAAYPSGTCSIHNKPLVDYLRLKFNFNPGNKFESPIASWVCKLPRNLKATFLRWFLTLDGEFDSHSGQIGVSQANGKNIVVLSYLLHSFGIVPTFGKKTQRLKIGMRDYARLTISGRRNLQIFAEEIGFEDQRIQARLDQYLASISKRSKETNMSIPVDIDSLRRLFKRSGLMREGFTDRGLPFMKKAPWYKAYEMGVRSNRISRSKLLLVIKSIEEQVARIEESNRLLTASGEKLEPHLSLIGLTLATTSKELGYSRKKLMRILRNGSTPELNSVLELVRARTREILQMVKSSLVQLRRLAATPLEFDRIIEIEQEDYDGLVFDLSVPGHRNFIGGTSAIVCHNTSLVEAITGIWASAHSEELRRGITIKVGYADAAFYKCPEQNAPSCYSTSPRCPIDGKATKLLRAVSFVDAPGHESLMTNMLAGAFLMDGALLVIAANEPVPRPQTREHLLALEMLGTKKLVIVQNKIDLVSEEEAQKNYEAIGKFVDKSIAEKAPIIPVSAQQKINIDAVIEAIEDVIPTPKRDPNAEALMYVVRSFDVNKPGTDVSGLSGGVLGGSLIRGVLRTGDEIEMRPGMPDERSGKYVPVNTRVESLGTGAGITEKVGPGGLVAVGTPLDPAFTKSDQMVGSVIGKPGTLPPVWEHVTLDYGLFDTVVGTAEQVKVERIRPGEPLRLNLGTASSLANATSVRDRAVELELKKPVCIEPGARAAISRKIAERWRLIGSGTLK